MLTAKAPAPEFLSSRLLSELFDTARLETGERIRVLDLGPASGHTLAFLNHYNSRLQVLDVGEKMLALSHRLLEDPDLDAGSIRGQLDDALGLQGAESFDVCLLWDFLNYLSAGVLHHFFSVLQPHLAPGARLHGFAVLNRSTVLLQQNYGLASGDTLMVAGGSGVELPFRHSQSVISALAGVAVKQSILRADGRLELLLAPV